MASLTMTMVPLGTTAPACIWLSRWPTAGAVDRVERHVVGRARRCCRRRCPSKSPSLPVRATWAPNQSATPQVVTPCFVVHIGAACWPTVKVIVITVSLSPA